MKDNISAETGTKSTDGATGRNKNNFQGAVTGTCYCMIMSQRRNAMKPGVKVPEAGRGPKADLYYCLKFFVLQSIYEFFRQKNQRVH